MEIGSDGKAAQAEWRPSPESRPSQALVRGTRGWTSSLGGTLEVPSNAILLDF